MNLFITKPIQFTESIPDLTDLLEESLSLIGKGYEQSAGFLSGAESARAYLRNFAPLLVFAPRAGQRRPPRTGRDLAKASVFARLAGGLSAYG